MPKCQIGHFVNIFHKKWIERKPYDKPKQIGHTKHIIKVIFVIYLKVDHYLIWEQERTLYDKFKIPLKSNELKVQKNMVLFIQKSFLQVHKMRWTWTEVRNWNDMSEPFFVKTQIFFHHNSPKNSTRTCWIATIRGLLKNDQHTIWIKPYRHQRDLHSERSRDAQGACVVGAAAKNPSPASIIKRKKSALQITETWSCSSGVDNEILFWKCNESRTWLMRSFAVEETIGFGGNFKSTCTILEK